MRTAIALLAALVAHSAYATESSPRVEEVAYQYPDADTMEFYRAVLDAMKITYRTETYEGKPVYWWRPSSQAQDAEVRGRVSQYVFATRTCPEKYRPTPTTPAGTVKVCEK